MNFTKDKNSYYYLSARFTKKNNPGGKSMHKFIISTFITLSLFSVSSVSAADNQCFKAYGNTPAEAFRAAAESLKNADAEMGPGWMKDNMQVRLLPEKIKGQFVAVIYSTVHHADTCNVERKDEVADKDRPKCDQIKCTI